MSTPSRIGLGPRAVAVPVIALFSALYSPAAAQTPAPRNQGPGPSSIAFELNLTDTASRQIQVTIRIEGLARPYIDLVSAAWLDRYRLRDGGRRITELGAEGADGHELAIERRELNRWQVHTAGTATAVIRYRFAATEQCASGAELVPHLARFIPGALLLFPPEVGPLPVTLRFSAPPTWKVASTLEPTFDPNLFRASSVEELMRTPVMVTAYRERFFAVHTMNVQLVLDPAPAGLDPRLFSQALERLAAQAVDLMGVIPARDYVFLFRFPEEPIREFSSQPGGAIIVWGGWSEQEGIEPLLEVTLEAFLRSWLGGRIQPAPMAEAGLVRPFVSDVLWFVEGVADYYAALLMTRAGLASPVAFSARIEREITRLQTTESRAIQSAASASSEVWYRDHPFYRRPERSIDYRNKGFLLVLLLDLEIRVATGNRSSLDDVLGFMAGWYGRGRRGIADSDEIIQVAGSIARTDLSYFSSRYVQGFEELPYRRLLEAAGWQLNPTTEQAAVTGFTWQPEGESQVRIQAVEPGSAAARAGLRSGDRVLTINSSLPAVVLVDRLDSARPGDIVVLRIQRGGQEQDIAFQLAAGTRQAYLLEPLSVVTPAQEALRASLLTGRR